MRLDGTWVAHPDLVPTAAEVFEQILQDRPHQKGRLRPDVHVEAPELLDFNIPGGQVTETGLRQNINVSLQYLDAWLRGSGAVAIYNLMEDTATAEISRAQVWNWVHHPSLALANGDRLSMDLYDKIVPQEISKIRSLYGEENFALSRIEEARGLFDHLVKSPEFPEFLTLLAYDKLE
jgi:malate synthase